ncbi:Formin-like protein 20, partial [Bienertia sinuspersici]
MKSEKECKSYLAGVVKSLQNFHPGASVMVFNFREGEQMSLLSDILINYDIVVVDYPRHYEGYPLLPLEMIHCFLRSSDSWLSLEGQKNVILMHCEVGGWPLLAFMLAGLLLYRKQHSGEQKTLDMVYKQAPKQLLSSVLSPLNAQASQLRYLQYITQRDLASEWPPSDAPVIADCLLLRNLPLFDGGKGCRPVVRVYGQDPSAKNNRGAQVLLSSLMEDSPPLKYSKEECVFVKLELRCEMQGDVFLECIHLQDDLVTEEIIFKVMFHTGFVQSNLLSLESTDIDVPWNTKLPKEFKAEVFFRDMNEVPEHITMELGGGEELHDSENEFFEVEEILIPMPGSIDKKDIDSIILPELKLLDKKDKDCTLHNGSPRWDLGEEEIDLISSKQITPDERNYQEVFKPQSDSMSTSTKNIDVEEIDLINVEERDVISSKHSASERGNHQAVSVLESDMTSTTSKNIVVVYSDGSEIQDVKVEIEPKYVAPSPAKPRQQITNKKNKWQEITAKTIKQQRVISQWVPRAKTPEAIKPKAPVYKWVPKGPTEPTEGA